MDYTRTKRTVGAYNVTAKEDGKFIVFLIDGREINDMYKCQIGNPGEMIRLQQKNWWTVKLENEVLRLCGVTLEG